MRSRFDTYRDGGTLSYACESLCKVLGFPNESQITIDGRFGSKTRGSLFLGHPSLGQEVPADKRPEVIRRMHDDAQAEAFMADHVLSQVRRLLP